MTTIASAHESRSAPAVIADEPGEAQGHVTGRVGDSVPVVEPLQAADPHSAAAAAPHSAAAAAVPDSTATDDADVGSEHGDAAQRLSKKGTPRRVCPRCWCFVWMKCRIDAQPILVVFWARMEPAPWDHGALLVSSGGLL